MLASVIVPAFNAEDYLARCLRSLVAQRMPANDYEVIVIDDGSTDQTFQVAANFDSSITLLRLAKNMGLPTAVNEGIRSAAGQYIVRVDADDYVSENFLPLLLDFMMTKTTADAVSCDYLIVDDSERVKEPASALERPIACGILFKRADLLDIGLYDESQRLHEDEELRIRFLRTRTIENLSLNLYRYRRHANNMTNNQSESKKYRDMLRAKHG